MADQEFQVIVANTDYQKLKQHADKNKNLLTQIAKLNEQITTLKQKNKDLLRAVYVRDAFIDYVASQCDYAFSTVLNLNIISNDITQSMYQDVVSHEQNGISSIELKEALELYIKKNKNIFERWKEVESKFMEMENKIKILEMEKAANFPKPNPNQFRAEPNKNTTFNSDAKKQDQELDKMMHDLISMKSELQKLNHQKTILALEAEKLKAKIAELAKQNEMLSKKKETQGEKSYIIKLMVDQYYRELQKNLATLGGLSDNEIGTVVANEMKGIVHYINNLAKKTNKHV